MLLNNWALLFLCPTVSSVFSLPGGSPGRAIVLPSALALALAAAAALAKCNSFYAKVFYVMDRALSGELSCPCDRSCSGNYIHAISHTEIKSHRI